jgi:hypothetical protein
MRLMSGSSDSHMLAECDMISPGGSGGDEMDATEAEDMGTAKVWGASASVKGGLVVCLRKRDMRGDNAHLFLTTLLFCIAGSRKIDLPKDNRQPRCPTTQCKECFYSNRGSKKSLRVSVGSVVIK